MVDQRSFSLSYSSLFKGVTKHNLRKIYSDFFPKNFYKYGETIYKQYEPAKCVYFILEGEV